MNGLHDGEPAAVEGPDRGPRRPHGAPPAWLAGLLIVLAAAPPLLLAVRAVAAGLPEFAVSSDNAVIELYTRAAERGAQWLGPYSRLGFHHPGPLVFYCLAPFYALAGERFSGLLLGGVLLNSAAVALMVLLAWRAARVAAAAWTASVLLAYQLFLGPALLYSVWNPNLSILPFMATIVALAAAAAGRPWALAAAAATGSLALQSHLGYLPPLAAATAVAAGLTWWRGALTGTLPGGRRALVARALPAAGILALLWLPVAVEEVTGKPGNLTRIAWFVVEGGTGHSLADGLRTVGGMLGGLALLPLGVSGEDAPHPGAAAFAASALLVAATAAGGWLAWRRRRHFAASLAAVTLAAVVAAVLAVTAIPGPVEPYLVRWVSCLGALGAIAALASLASPAAPERDALSRGIAFAAGIALVAANLAAGARFPSLEAFARTARFAQVERLIAPVESVLRTAEVRAVRVGIAHGPAWESAAGVALRLVKDGFGVGIDPAWVDVFGAGLRTGPAGAGLVFVDPDRAESFVATGVAEPVAREGAVAVVLVRRRATAAFRFGFAAPESVLYCDEGVSGPEGGDDGFRWSRGPRSTLTLPLAPGRPYRLTLELGAVTLAGRRQEVGIAADGREIGWFPVGPRRSAVVVAIPASGVGGTKLTLRYAFTVRPSRGDGRPDRRELGVRLYSLAAEPLPPDGAPAAPATGGARLRGVGD